MLEEAGFQGCCGTQLAQERVLLGPGVVHDMQTRAARHEAQVPRQSSQDQLGSERAARAVNPTSTTTTHLYKQRYGKKKGGRGGRI